jgi:hypothetical protein
MTRTIDERRADHAQRGSLTRSCRLPTGSVQPVPMAGDDAPLPPGWGAAAGRTELRTAAKAVRRAQVELLRWEALYDTCCSGDPNRYIADIHAAEKRLEAARAALRALARD